MASNIPGRIIEGSDPQLYNSDLAPTTNEGRTWGWTNIAALWIGMVVCVPTYMLAAGMIKQGMSWSQAIVTCFWATSSFWCPCCLSAMPVQSMVYLFLFFEVFIRHRRCERTRNFARSCRLWLVWHPNVDWQPGYLCLDQRTDRRCAEGR